MIDWCSIISEQIAVFSGTVRTWPRHSAAVDSVWYDNSTVEGSQQKGRRWLIDGEGKESGGSIIKGRHSRWRDTQQTSFLCTHSAAILWHAMHLKFCAKLLFANFGHHPLTLSEIDEKVKKKPPILPSLRTGGRLIHVEHCMQTIWYSFPFYPPFLSPCTYLSYCGLRETGVHKKRGGAQDNYEGINWTYILTKSIYNIG